jgi:hypothetical protein
MASGCSASGPGWVASRRGAEGFGLGAGLRRTLLRDLDPSGEPARRQDPPRDERADRHADEPRGPLGEALHDARERPRQVVADLAERPVADRGVARKQAVEVEHDPVERGKYQRPSRSIHPRLAPPGRTTSRSPPYRPRRRGLIPAARRPRLDPRSARPDPTAGASPSHDPDAIVPDGRASRVPSGPRRPAPGPGWPLPRSSSAHGPPSRSVWKTSSVSSRPGRPAARRRACSSLTPLPNPVPSSRTTAVSAGNRANSSAHVRPSRASTLRPVSQQRLSGTTAIRTGLRPK